MVADILKSELLRDVVFEEAMEGGVMVLDTKGIILQVNQQILLLLESFENDLVGKSFFDIIKLTESPNGPLMEDNVHPVKKALDMGLTQMMPYFCFHKLPNGKELSLVLKSITVKEPETMQLKAVIVKLRKASRQFDLKDMQTSFVSLAAHQLKTPAGVTQGYLELALKLIPKSAQHDKLRKYVLTAYESNQTLCRIAKDLLNATKIHGGLLQPSVVKTDIQELFNKKQEAYSRWAQTKKINLSFELNDEFVVQTDPNIMSELFDILLHNALKYTPMEGRVNVRAVWLPNLKNVFEIHVQDTGPGMKHADPRASGGPLDEMFSKTSHGVGLRLAHQYAAILKGDLFYENIEPHGTKCTLRLPHWT